MPSSSQPRQGEWTYQWSVLEDSETWLFEQWIAPRRFEDFRGKTVLDAACGPGHHLRVAARYAKRTVGVDLNTVALAREKTRDLPNVDIVEGDIASWDSGERFDVVYCIGAVHHTANPDETVRHLSQLLKPGGLLILWVYAWEGNTLNRWLVEPIKRMSIRHLPRSVVLGVGHVLTLALYPIVHTIYRLPLSFLPYHSYFGNFRQLSYKRNLLNVFDKLNAPVTHFITRSQAERWMQGFDDVHISQYVGVSWRISGFTGHSAMNEKPRK